MKVLNKFLEFLGMDMDEHPDRAQPLDGDLVEYIQALEEDDPIDLDKPLDGRPDVPPPPPVKPCG